MGESTSDVRDGTTGRDRSTDTAVPDDPERVVRGIATTELPDDVEDVLDVYRERVGGRDEFIWRWLYATFPAVRLDCVPERHCDAVRRLKLALGVLVVIADDCAERDGDRATFAELRRLPEPGREVDPDRPGVDADAVRAAATAWSYVDDGLDDAPRREAFDAVFRFDLRQTFAAMDYSRLVNDEVAVANRPEMEAYGPHNMMMFPAAAIDLMHSPSFDRAELGALRATVWRAQRLGEIGNCVTTWERELREGDVASDVFVRATERGAFDDADLAAVASGEGCPPGVTDRVREAGVEGDLLAEWDAQYAAALARADDADSVDLRAYVRGTRRVLRNQLAARGQK